MLTRYLPWFVILALLAEVLGTIGGFGSSVYFVPMASYFMDFQSVLGITALYHLSSNLTKIGFFRKGIDKKLVLYLGIPAVLFVMLGAWLSRFVNPEILGVVLGVFLVGFSLLFILDRTREIEATHHNAITGGGISGFLAGLLGTGGAIRGAVMAAFNLSKEKFIATSALIDLGIDLSRSFVYAYNGYIHRHDLYLVPILIVVSIVGTYLGKRILDRISQVQFRKIVLYLLLAIGLVTLVVHARSGGILSVLFGYG